MCDCGKSKTISSSKLISGNTSSCGCLQQESRLTSKKKYNRYDLLGEFGIGYTTKEELFYFDLEDFEKIKNYCWRISVDGYVITTKKDTHILFHRVVLDCPKGMVCDHINNNNKNDNRKSNIRIATYSQNMQNRDTPTNNTSGIKGVYQISGGIWGYEITYDGKRERKFGFTKKEAIEKRKDAELKYHREFCYKNREEDEKCTVDI